MTQEELIEQERREQEAIANDPRLNIRMPEAPESERWLLCMLLNSLEAGALGEIWHQHGRRMRNDLFLHEGRRTIYFLIEELAVSGATADVITFTGMLRNRNELDMVGGASEISDLFALTLVTQGLLEQHLATLEQFRMRRGMLKASWAMAAAAKDSTVDCKQALERAEGDLFNLHEQTSKRGTRHIREVLPVVVEEIDMAYQNKGHIAGGLQLGFTDLDRITMGLKTGLFVIAARPSRGKTVLACQIALNVGTGRGHYKEFAQTPVPVLFFSLETTDRSLTRRMLLNEWQVPISKARDGMMKREEQQKMGEAVKTLARSQIYLHESFGMSIQELRATARMLIQRLPERTDKLPKCIVLIDYLQLLSSNTKRAQLSRQTEIAEISTGLKHLAHEFDIPVISLAQLNREGDKSRPGMADLRESGQIEQDADYIGLICDAPEGFGGGDNGEVSADEFMGFDLAKNKDGPVTTDGNPLVFYFDKSIFRLRSWTDSLYSNNPSNYQAGYQRETKAVQRKQGGKRKDDNWAEGLTE
jgi:replicative DNA helicase